MLPNLVDPSVMDSATAWLNYQVNDRGGVTEPGRVIHTEMQVSRMCTLPGGNHILVHVDSGQNHTHNLL